MATKISVYLRVPRHACVKYEIPLDGLQVNNVADGSDKKQGSDAKHCMYGDQRRSHNVQNCSHLKNVNQS